MKLTNKALALMGLTTLVFLTASLFLVNHNSIYIIGLSVIALIAVYFGIRMLMIKRIEKLNVDMSRVLEKNGLTLRLEAENSDEIELIAKKINAVLENAKVKHQSYEQRMEKITKELKDQKLHLQQELSAKSRTEKIMIDREYLMQLGHSDTLTSLPNGIFFNEVLNKAINHSRRRNQILAVLLIDIDMFNLVIETLGSDNSDLVLKEIGKRFSNVLRKEDLLAKLDGDEFIVLLNDVNKPKFASMVAEKLLNICTQLLKVGSHEFTLTASIGISVFPYDGESLEELIENADRALFKAKQAGGNVYQFNTEEMHVEALEYIQLESALRKAIHNNELALYYQPKYRIKTGNISGVEALLRWEHPAMGIISPVKFIQLAEESGLSMQIGEWALREACERIKYWQRDGYEHISIALKLSPKQFRHPDLVKMIKKIIGSVGIDPQYIEFEITEQTVMENVELAASILDKIKATGVQLSIDHFGTGYTSISYLKQFPINSIKLDKSFIKGIPNKPNDIAITSAVIALAHNLGLEVVAEGVETAEQIQFLLNENCDIVQGYFLSHPVTAQKIINLFKKLQEEVLV
ncbi:Phytochrome-like protein cph2 [Aquicella siphonis]|uniref:cyclic-guanylate-specific phosphodiesterase n=1 Tax=Aquicella siphonis TaxID=254247 RepID=A0A5E4PHH1_9COXI|nr:bifunctional diguanylate cyclase/phosphodiesterase [Aquicella siphonis]VVC75902.1 Phytochrome-like protein cph2 [Aquicella siphonis]